MNPTVARGGRSFKGAFAYYMHDKGTNTRDRIAWTHTVNMLTTNPDKAWRVMAYTAMHSDRLKEAAGVPATGRKSEKPVMAYSLSWHPEQSPTPEHMREIALRSLEVMGLTEHQAVLIAHNDTPHAHVHVIVNRIHPVTGKTASDSYTHRKLSDLALEYAREHGLTYSPQREANKELREAGQSTRYMDSKIAEAWANSTDGKSFVAALKERGFELAQGTKRLVVVDAYGKVHNPTRHIEGVNAKAFRDRLKGVDLGALRDADAVAAEHAARHEQQKAEKVKLRDKAPAVKPAFEKAAGDAGKDNAATPEKSVAIAEKKPARGEKAQAEPKPEVKKADRPKAKEKASALADAFARNAAGKSAPAEATHTDKGEKDKTEGQQGAVSSVVLYSPEEKKAVRLNELQNRQLEDRAEIEAGFHERIVREKDEMSKFYGLREKERRLEALREKCEHPPFWRKLFGLARRDRQELGALEKGYENAKGRYDERIQVLEIERARTLEQLKTTQEREWTVAVRLNEQDSGERGRDKPERDRDHKPKNPRGPSVPSLDFGR